MMKGPWPETLTVSLAAWPVAFPACSVFISPLTSIFHMMMIHQKYWLKAFFAHLLSIMSSTAFSIRLNFSIVHENPCVQRNRMGLLNNQKCGPHVRHLDQNEYCRENQAILPNIPKWFQDYAKNVFCMTQSISVLFYTVLVPSHNTILITVKFEGFLCCYLIPLGTG